MVLRPFIALLSKVIKLVNIDSPQVHSEQSSIGIILFKTIKLNKLEAINCQLPTENCQLFRMSTLSNNLHRLSYFRLAQ